MMQMSFYMNSKRKPPNFPHLQPDQKKYIAIKMMKEEIKSTVEFLKNEHIAIRIDNKIYEVTESKKITKRRDINFMWKMIKALQQGKRYVKFVDERNGSIEFD